MRRSPRKRGFRGGFLTFGGFPAMLGEKNFLGGEVHAFLCQRLHCRGPSGGAAAARGDEFRKNAGLTEKGYALRYASPTNQVFCVIENAAMERLTGRAEFGFWETYDETHTVIRFAAG